MDIIKEVNKTWSNCELDYVKEFVIHSESDVANLPKCCIGSTAIVCETGNRYVCTKDGSWKPREEAMAEGAGSDSSGSADSSGGSAPLVVEFTTTDAVNFTTTIADEELMAAFYEGRSVIGKYVYEGEDGEIHELMLNFGGRYAPRNTRPAFNFYTIVNQSLYSLNGYSLDALTMTKTALGG